MKKGIIKVNGNASFSVPVTDFEISPLSADANLYQDSLADETTNSVVVGEISAGEYTKVANSIAGTKFHINTTDNFVIVYNYE